MLAHLKFLRVEMGTFFLKQMDPFGASTRACWFRSIRSAVGGLFVALALCMPAIAFAVTVAPSPKLSVKVYGGFWGLETFTAKPDQYPYSVGATVEIPGGYLGKTDLYIGIISPGFEKIFTWTSNADAAPVLGEGLTPIVRDIDMQFPRKISTSDFLSQQINYLVTGKEAAGVYWVFAVLVSAGRAPNDEKNWSSITSQPLVFR